MKIAIYSRKSVFTGKGESIENQIELCKKYCDSNYIDDKEYLIYEDEGFSGKNLNRPEFQKMIDNISNIDILVCYRLDRISRNVADFSNTLEILQKNKCQFVSIKEQFDTSTPMGLAMVYISSVFAQLERDTIAERVRDNMLELAKHGKWSGGQLPLGFDSKRETYIDQDNKQRSFVKLIENPEELKIINYIFNEFLKTSSLLSVTKALNTLNIKGKNNCDFDRNQIKRILRNPVYAKSSELTNSYLLNEYSVYGLPNGNGYLTYNKNKNKSEWIAAVAGHEGIINATDWLKVQQILDKNKLKNSNRAGTGDNISLFSGLLKCKECGDSMVIKYNNKNSKGEPNLYYICSSKTRKLSKCKTPNLQVIRTDARLIEGIKDYCKDFLNNKIDAMIQDIQKNDSKSITSEIEKQIQTKEKQINNLVNQLSNIDNSDVSQIIIKQISTLTDESKNLKLKLTNNKIEVYNVKSNTDKLLNLKSKLLYFDKNIEITKNISDKRLIIRDIIKSITYDHKSNTFNIEINYP